MVQHRPILTWHLIATRSVVRSPPAAEAPLRSPPAADAPRPTGGRWAPRRRRRRRDRRRRRRAASRRGRSRTRSTSRATAAWRVRMIGGLAHYDGTAGSCRTAGRAAHEELDDAHDDEERADRTRDRAVEPPPVTCGHVESKIMECKFTLHHLWTDVESRTRVCHTSGAATAPRTNQRAFRDGPAAAPRREPPPPRHHHTKRRPS
jgi:hypothetical protein